jgi:hypothetical protein
MYKCPLGSKLWIKFPYLKNLEKCRFLGDFPHCASAEAKGHFKLFYFFCKLNPPLRRQTGHSFREQAIRVWNDLDDKARWAKKGPN